MKSPNERVIEGLSTLSVHEFDPLISRCDVVSLGNKWIPSCHLSCLCSLCISVCVRYWETLTGMYI